MNIPTFGSFPISLSFPEENKIGQEDFNAQKIIQLFYQNNKERITSFLEKNKEINLIEIVDKKLFTRNFYKPTIHILLN